MKQTRMIMGMPITLIVEGDKTDKGIFDKVFDYFTYVDEKYSPYKPTSEVSQINNGLIESDWSQEMQTIMQLCEQTKQETNGYFNVWYNGHFDPSGLVKGWAIQQAAQLLKQLHCENFYVEAGGDIQVGGHNADKNPWQIGIRSPFDPDQIVKVIESSSNGVATSGTYIRGQHIYNPHKSGTATSDIASLTVVGPTIYDADRFATAAFAMGKSGINFIESLKGYEGYMIDTSKQATLTNGFASYVRAA